MKRVGVAAEPVTASADQNMPSPDRAALAQVKARGKAGLRALPGR